MAKAEGQVYEDEELDAELEARLPMDPRTRDFVRINGKPYEREPLDAAWILERWPADLEQARHV